MLLISTLEANGQDTEYPLPLNNLYEFYYVQKERGEISNLEATDVTLTLITECLF